MKAMFTTAAFVLAFCSANVLAQCGTKTEGGDTAKVTKVAGDGAKCCAGAKAAGKTCTDKVAGKTCSDKSACGMPKMAIKVGDETTCCPKQAEELAQKNADAKVVYLVSGKEYADKVEAMTAYRDALEAYVPKVTTVAYAVAGETMTCPMSAEKAAKDKSEAMTYRVASYDFDKKDDAEKAAKAGAAAAEAVTMKMVVDGKEVACTKDMEKTCGTKTAGATCNKDGAKKTADGESKDATYVVGETKTCCPIMARIELAKARINAAMVAIEKAGGKQVAGA